MRLHRKTSRRHGTSFAGPNQGWGWRVRESLLRQGINDFEEWKAAEMSVMGVNASNSVLSHENCGMRIEHEVAGDARDVRGSLSEHIFVPLRLLEDSGRRRCKCRIEKSPGIRERQGLGEDAWMRRHSQKLVHDTPRQIPRFCATSPFREQCSACLVSR